MDNLIAWIPALPLLGFACLYLFGRLLPRPVIAWIGCGSVSTAALLVMGLAVSVLRGTHLAYSQTLWQWVRLGNFSCAFDLRIDALSLVFVFIITFVGALIHIYSAAFMKEDRDYARFFASMNLFVCSMLLLVMANNLLLLYLGWEGVGLCSYLLIGFWYENPVNSRAANKAFYMTRIGDTAMAIGLFLLFRELGTLDIPTILKTSPGYFGNGDPRITLIALLLLAGGIGKSAQLPLQTWLPDAMAGPSPVSALIHAATMVTAGVYLIARMHVLFILSPIAMAVTAIIGGATLLLAGCSALVQTDIKRILAYSTISQIGYMFLALGIGAWSAAIFHFFTHAFFKALLFLAAGAIIESLHHEHNIFRMGGLRNRLPLVFATFLAGAAALAALPFISAGFYSKDQILWYAWSAEKSSPALWLAAIMGAFITALYTARLVLVVFWGEMKTPVSARPGRLMTVPLIILAVLSIGIGFIEWPHNLLPVSLFSNLVQKVLPLTLLKQESELEWLFQLIAVAVTLSGAYLGYILYYRRTAVIAQWNQVPAIRWLRGYWLRGWDFDGLYHTLFVRPFLFISQVNKSDVIDRLNQWIPWGSQRLGRLFSLTQNGSLRWYVAGVLFGILFILTLQLFV
jgi:NADH-quinone oxidoreductase subunit L